MTVALNEQESEKRYILHILHYIPNKIADEILTIEDVIPLYNIRFAVNVPKNVRKIQRVPDKQEIKFTICENGSVEFCVPEINGHCMVELSY